MSNEKNQKTRKDQLINLKFLKERLETEPKNCELLFQTASLIVTLCQSEENPVKKLSRIQITVPLIARFQEVCASEDERGAEILKVARALEMEAREDCSSKMEISLETSLACNSSTRQAILSVCAETLRIFENKFGNSSPVLGRKPILIVQATDGVPRAVINDLPRRYTVALTCLEGTGARGRIPQILFQASHELLHVFVDPRIDHPVVEIAAIAVSLVCLKIFAQRLAGSPHALKFASYLKSVKRGAPKDLSIFDTTLQNRATQLSLAIHLEPAFERYDWKALQRVGECLELGSQVPGLEWTKWERIAPESPLIRALRHSCVCEKSTSPGTPSSPSC